MQSVLFFAQSDERVHPGGTPCRNETSEKRNGSENGCNGNEGSWIAWRNLEKHGPEDSRNDRSSDETRCQSDYNDPHAFSERHAQNIEALRAESDADSDFVRTLAE